MRCILIGKHVVMSPRTHEISCAAATSVQFQTPKHIIATKLSGWRSEPLTPTHNLTGDIDLGEAGY